MTSHWTFPTLRIFLAQGNCVRETTNCRIDLPDDVDSVTVAQAYEPAPQAPASRLEHCVVPVTGGCALHQSPIYSSCESQEEFAMDTIYVPIIILLVMGIVVLLSYLAGYAAGVNASRPHIH